MISGQFFFIIFGLGLALISYSVESNTEAFEYLMRALLVLPKKPAVINVQTFGLAYPLLSTGGDLHTREPNRRYSLPTSNCSPSRGYVLRRSFAEHPQRASPSHPPKLLP